MHNGGRTNNNSKNDDGTKKEAMLVNIKGSCFKCGNLVIMQKIVIHQSRMVREKSSREHFTRTWGNKLLRKGQQRINV
jgi:hypothetical protein